MLNLFVCCSCGAAGVETHQLLPREDLQQADEHASIAQVRVQVPNAAGDAAQVRVHPLGEGLLLHGLSLVCNGTHKQEAEEGEKKKAYHYLATRH